MAPWELNGVLKGICIVKSQETATTVGCLISQRSEIQIQLRASKFFRARNEKLRPSFRLCFVLDVPTGLQIASSIQREGAEIYPFGFAALLSLQVKNHPGRENSSRLLPPLPELWKLQTTALFLNFCPHPKRSF
eukprot:Gb_18378 [translate_table: standard]